MLYALIIVIAIGAYMCGNSEPQVNPEITEVQYPYEWDTVSYNRIISYVGYETTSLNFNIKVTFNEEFIEIVNTEFTEDPIIFIGRWTNKYTFVIDDNKGVITVNLKTRFMTIQYQNNIKEIYTL